MESNSVKCSYFDASALIKLVSEEASEEPGRSAVRKYIKREANLYTTSHCISEALGVLKVKCFYRKYILTIWTLSIVLKSLPFFMANTPSFQMNRNQFLLPLTNCWLKSLEKREPEYGIV